MSRELTDYQFFFNDKYVSKETNDIIEKEDKLIIKIVSPGLKKKDISLEVSQNKLSISLPKQRTRTISLHESLDKENITAKYIAGILYISVPKKEIKRTTIKVD